MRLIFLSREVLIIIYMQSSSKKVRDSNKASLHSLTNLHIGHNSSNLRDLFGKFPVQILRSSEKMADFTRIELPSSIAFQPHEAEEVLMCPYDMSHVCLSTRVMVHLLKCRRNYEKALKDKGEEPHLMTCRYNWLHLVLKPELLFHERFCPNRTTLTTYQIEYYNSSIEKRTEEYQTFGTPVLQLPLEMQLAAPKDITINSRPNSLVDSLMPASKPNNPEIYKREDLLMNDALGQFCLLRDDEEYPPLALKGKTAPKWYSVKVSSHEVPYSTKN